MQILTEEELTAVLKTWGYPSTALPFARALEGAVLDKAWGVRTVTMKEKRLAVRAAYGLGQTSNVPVNVAFPIPTVRIPRTVTLSDGTQVEGGKVAWQFIQTPGDARKLADLAENPYTDIPDPAA